ncbi:MAG: hypothetical protein GXP63_01735 [DPANN group archaeon]|nr:hypothetical protein [DPANN group archaeon]
MDRSSAMMKGKKRETMKASFLLLVGMFILVSASFDAAADPVAPTTLSEISSSTRTFPGGNKTTNATAGYLTEVKIEGIAVVTEGWQGYYGNISGEVILDDADNNTLFSWNLISPGGEILAIRNSSVDWSSGQVSCPNTTHISTENTLIFPGIYGDDTDNLTNTFNDTTHPAFSIGSNSFSADKCNYSLATYVNDNADTARTFNETLLYSENTKTMIYVGLINPKQEGFKSGTDKHDFQMLVGEDGHGNNATTRYFFFVELNP